jgi:sugar-specific transcriptional regulator TrmB
MLVKKEFLNNLKDFGLNSYETKLWIALLSRGVSSASELSDISGVPRSRTYDVLDSLEKKGFIVQKLGKPIKYIAVPPHEVIERVKKNIAEEANQNINMIENFKGTDFFDELNTLHSKGIEFIDPNEMSGVLKDRKNVYHHLEYLINNAKESVIIITNEDGLLRKSNLLQKTLKKASDRKVKIKIAADISKKYALSIIEKLNFADIRHSGKLQGRFFVIDNSHVVFPFLDGIEIHSSYDGGIWINTPNIAKSLTTMFNSFWKDMTPIEKLTK